MPSRSSWAERMRQVRHVVLFVKAPRRGQVKQRLACEIGAGAALSFQRTTIAALLRGLGHDPRWRLWLAVTPERDHAFRHSHRGPRLAQGRGDLGQRMAHCFTLLPPGPAVLIGGDIPEIRSRHIAAAFTLLRSRWAVFGPAVDGGYWLVGLARRRPERGLFAGVRWSSAKTLDDTLAHFKDRPVGFVTTLADIDDAAAYAAWRGRQGKVRAGGFQC